MKAKNAAGLLAGVAALFASGLVLAQNSPAPPALKTIGVPTNAKPRVVPSMIVLNARGAVLEGRTLKLDGVSSNAIMFADRPVRAAGHALTAQLLEEWRGGDSFAKDPPNATVSVFSKDGSSVQDVVVVLKSPKLDGDKLTFDVDVLEGGLAGSDGPASIFIDTLGFSFAPFSFGGAARRTVHQPAWYAGYAAAAAPYEPGSTFASPGYSMPWQ
jgi:hypothetical protein